MTDRRCPAEAVNRFTKSAGRCRLMDGHPGAHQYRRIKQKRANL